MKRFIALFLMLVMLVSMAPVSMAADIADNSTARADALNGLGLFNGTDKGYELERSSTRAEGLTMLIRMLGKEDEAKAENPTHPFTDTRVWFSPYVGYAYANGLTTGRDPVKGIFDPDTAMAAKDYCTFILRALGYDDKAGDFTWAKAVDKAVEIGLCTSAGGDWLKNNAMTRATMVDLSYAALTKSIKGSSEKLWETLAADAVFTSAAAGKYIEDYVFDIAFDPNYDPVTLETKTVTTSTGNVVVNVVKVDLSDPRVRISANIVNDTVGQRKPFSDIVKESGADVVVTANFMEADADGNYPLGHIMVDGDLKYCSSGLSSMGITYDKQLTFGRPSIQAWVKPLDVEKERKHWVGYSVNVPEQYMNTDYSVLYTPSFGSSFTATVEGKLITGRNGVIVSVVDSVPGTVVNIPSDGFVLYLAPVAEGLYLFKYPEIGQKVEIEYYLLREDFQNFQLGNLETIVSGGPRLVTNGAIDYTDDAQFSDSRFTTMSTSRTAVGRDKDGNLLLISVNSATIAQMREAMLAIGCVDAFNTDGGASTAMYFEGQYIIQAGRNLANTIHVFVDD